MRLRFAVDDLSSPEVRALVTEHVRRMHAISPRESVHAFDLDALRRPELTFWSVWDDEHAHEAADAARTLAGIGALLVLDPPHATRGEIKSMRVADAFLGRGVGRAILDHVVAEARARGMRAVFLETGGTEPFTPALRLYESAGFVRCAPFEGYRPDPFSVFMTLDLTRPSK